MNKNYIDDMISQNKYSELTNHQKELHEIFRREEEKRLVRNARAKRIFKKRKKLNCVRRIFSNVFLN